MQQKKANFETDSQFTTRSGPWSKVWKLNISSIAQQQKRVRNYYTCDHYDNTLEKLCFSIIWRNKVICLEFYGDNMVNLITKMVSMGIEWGHCGK